MAEAGRPERGSTILHAVGGMLPAEGVAGVKTWVYTPAGASPLLVVWDLRAGGLLGVVEAFRMGQLRTAATSGLATRVLARADADVLALLGTGRQALTQAHAVAAVRPLRRAQVFGRDRARLAAFCDRLAATTGLDVEGFTDARAALSGAAIVTTVTRAGEPFITADMLPPGAHINAVGAIVPSRRELTTDALARCDVLVADSPEQAREDAGELIAAVDAGVLDWTGVTPLSSVVEDPAGARPGDHAITLFKALGVGLADVALGLELLARARGSDAGHVLPATPDPHLSEVPNQSRRRAHAR